MPLSVSRAGLEKLVARLEANFALTGGHPVDVGPGLYGPSLFYAGTGRFSWTNVCNHWTASLVNVAGLPVVPVLATLPRGLILDLTWRSGATPLPQASHRLPRRHGGIARSAGRPLLPWGDDRDEGRDLSGALSSLTLPLSR